MSGRHRGSKAQNAKNKTIQGRERTMILRVLHFFEEEKQKGRFVIPVNQVLKRTCAATGVSLSRITRIKREEENNLQTTSPLPTSTSSSEQASTAGKKRHRPVHNKLHVDDFTICSIGNIIDRFYTEQKEAPTLKNILAVAKAELNFPSQKETLRKILTEKLGYTFKNGVIISEIQDTDCSFHDFLFSQSAYENC